MYLVSNFGLPRRWRVPSFVFPSFFPKITWSNFDLHLFLETKKNALTFPRAQLPNSELTQSWRIVLLL